MARTRDLRHGAIYVAPDGAELVALWDSTHQRWVFTFADAARERRPNPEDAPYVVERGVLHYGDTAEYRLRDLRRAGMLTRPDLDHPAYGLAEWGGRYYVYSEVALYDVDGDGPVGTDIVAVREVTPADLGADSWEAVDAWDYMTLWRALGQLCDDPDADDPLLAAELEYALQDGRARVLHDCPS